MATETAEQVEQVSPRTAAPTDPTRTPLADLSTQIFAAESKRREAAERQRKGLEERAATVAPKLEAAQTALTAPLPTPPAPVTMPPPPSRTLRDYLASVDGEAPEHTVMQFISGLGVLAAGAAGMVKGDARGGLAALTGALAGWQAGDRERADRHFADWKAQTDLMLEHATQEREAYRDRIANQKFSLEAAIKDAELEAIKQGNTAAVAAFATGEAETALAFLVDRQKHEDTVAATMARLTGMHEEKERDRQFRADLAREAREARGQMQKEQDEATLSAYTPEALTTLGQQWALGQPVQVGMGRAGQLVRGKVVEAGIQWAKDNNIDLAALPGLRAEVATARATLTALSKMRAFTLANADNFERHLDSLVRLSERVDRSGRPVVARYQLQLKRDYEGDPETAAYSTQAYEVALEFAKLMVGTAQGDEATRSAARQEIDRSLSPDQLRAVAKQLKQNAEQRVQVWDDRLKEQSAIINNAAKLKATPLPDDPLGIRR